MLANVTEYYTPLRTRSNCGLKQRRRRRRNRKAHDTKDPTTDADQSESDLQIITENIDTATAAGEATTDPCDSSDGVKCEGDGAKCPAAGDSEMYLYAGRRWEAKRTVNQLFIRGDNVVLVTPLHSSTSRVLQDKTKEKESQLTLHQI